MRNTQFLLGTLLVTSIFLAGCSRRPSNDTESVETPAMTGEVMTGGVDTGSLMSGDIQTGTIETGNHQGIRKAEEKLVTNTTVASFTVRENIFPVIKNNKDYDTLFVYLKNAGIGGTDSWDKNTKIQELEKKKLLEQKNTLITLAREKSLPIIKTFSIKDISYSIIVPYSLFQDGTPGTSCGFFFSPGGVDGPWNCVIYKKTPTAEDILIPDIELWTGVNIQVIDNKYIYQKHMDGDGCGAGGNHKLFDQNFNLLSEVRYSSRGCEGYEESLEKDDLEILAIQEPEYNENQEENMFDALYFEKGGLSHTIFFSELVKVLLDDKQNLLSLKPKQLEITIGGKRRVYDTGEFEKKLNGAFCKGSLCNSDDIQYQGMGMRNIGTEKEVSIFDTMGYDISVSSCKANNSNEYSTVSTLLNKVNDVAVYRISEKLNNNCKIPYRVKYIKGDTTMVRLFSIQ